MFEVARPESLRKFAMLLVGTLKSPKLWNKLIPPPGLVPPVMLYWVCPLGSATGGLTCVFSPEGVMGDAAWAWLILAMTEKKRIRLAQIETMTCRKTRGTPAGPAISLMLNPPSRVFLGPKLCSPD